MPCFENMGYMSILDKQQKDQLHAHVVERDSSLWGSRLPAMGLLCLQKLCCMQHLHFAWLLLNLQADLFRKQFEAAASVPKSGAEYGEAMGSRSSSPVQLSDESDGDMACKIWSSYTKQ